MINLRLVSFPVLSSLFVLSTFLCSTGIAQFHYGMAPLEVGNIWVYQVDDYSRRKYTVIKDTTLDDSVNYFTTIYSSSPLDPMYYRLNEEGFYARYHSPSYPSPYHEIAYYKKGGVPGDSWSQFYNIGLGDSTYFEILDTLTWPVFDQWVNIKHVFVRDSSGLFLEGILYTDEFGMISKIADFAPPFYLTGCRIGGITYGDTSLVVGVKDFRSSYDFYLHQNYPNPFNSATVISYEVKDQSFIELIVYDIMGREIDILINEEKPPGKYSVNFNGVNLPSGIYFYRLNIGGKTEIRKMTLLK
jgi:hypothetical protein